MHESDRRAGLEPLAERLEAASVCMEVAHFAYTSAGSQGLRNPSLVQRCFRDLYTGGEHIFVDRKSYEELANGHLGIEPGGPMG